MREKRLDVQGLRALAILMVVAYHGRLGLAGGFTGVDVFFVISGFVITGTLLWEFERDGSLDLRAFYVRRVKRLLPGLATMLTFVALAGILLAPVVAVHMSAVTGISASVFGSNWYLDSLPSGYFDPAASLDPLLHTWTLAVEEQFYVVFPLVLLVAWRTERRGRLAAAAAIAGLACLSFAVAEHWANTAFGFYASPARAWEFGAGSLVALGQPVWRRVPMLVCSAVAAAGLTGLGAIAYADFAGSSGLATTVGAPVLCTCVLLVAGSRANSVSGLLGSRPLSAVGDLSYSWYLWHWPLIVFATALEPAAAWPARAAAVGSLAPAWVSYRCVENPIRNSRVRGRLILRLAGVCIALPLAASFAQLHVRLVSVGTAYAFSQHVDRRRGCDSAIKADRRTLCTWRAAGAHGTVVLIGDSNAGQFTEPVVAAAGALGMDVVDAVESGCPLVPFRLTSPDNDYGPCLAADRASMQWLRATRPSLVILAMRSDVYIGDRRYGAIDGSQVTHSAVEKGRLWSRGLRSELGSLSDVGIPVVVVHPVPIVNLDRGDCAVVLVLEGHCLGAQSRSSVDRALARTMAAEQRAVRGIPDASLLDLESVLCSATLCSSSKRGVPLYLNRLHLSVPGALTLTPVFTRLIARDVPTAASRWSAIRLVFARGAAGSPTPR